MVDFSRMTGESAVWAVGALCRAVSDSLEARFNPVSVRGEVIGFSRAASGHCYFSIKDEGGQIRCAMFRRAAMNLQFSPKDGELVELQGRLGVYEQRGDLQLVVESMQRAGQGAWFEQFLRLKAKLEAEGLFDNDRKRSLPIMPRGIGLVTSAGAAALHDVATALQRRVPHIPVVLSPALVQGASAPASIVEALNKLYLKAEEAQEGEPAIDVILLVRGGGSMEDLWAFNDEAVARAIVQSPVPLVSGVGHETDFTIADFCADLRAPTPTAAAEMVAQPRQLWLDALSLLQSRMEESVLRWIDRHSQRLDTAQQRLGRPSSGMAQQRLRLSRLEQHMQHAARSAVQWQAQTLRGHAAELLPRVQRQLRDRKQHLESIAQRLELLNPQHVLARGYSLVTDISGSAVTRVEEAPVGSSLKVHLSNGQLDVTVTHPRLL